MLVLAATQPIGISTQKWRMICWRRVSATIIMKKKKMPTESHLLCAYFVLSVLNLLLNHHRDAVCSVACYTPAPKPRQHGPNHERDDRGKNNLHIFFLLRKEGLPLLNRCAPGNSPCVALTIFNVMIYNKLLRALTIITCTVLCTLLCGCRVER